jgi:hypothetical protein
VSPPGHGHPYDEEERLYAPPLGSFDPEWVVRLVQARRPGIDWDLAYRLAVHAWRHLNASPQLGPADLSAYCALDEPTAREDEVDQVVGAALDFCDAFQVEPPPAEVA